jgi:anti-sigma factor RsiW
MSEQARLTPEERKDLVAFLDGEADEAIAARLESKIANSASTKREVDALRQAYDLLDFLYMPPPSEQFTSRTVEQIALAGELKRERLKDRAALARNVVWIGLWVLGIAVTFMVGAEGVKVVPDRNQLLRENKAVLERFEEYRAAGDIEFLRLLRQSHYLDDVEHALELEEEPGTAIGSAPARP